MRQEDFDYVAKLLKERSGIVLATDKMYLLESRLLPVARKHGMSAAEAIVAELRRRPEPTLVREVVEAMTTNESFFFRDGKPFDQFRDFILPELLKARAGRRALRIWSAACSSGQEPYSLAILLAEAAAKLAGWNVDILASDLSTEILERAQSGMYSQFEVQRGLPIQLLVKYFMQRGDRWQLNSHIIERVNFRCLNLLEDFAALGTFDMILCRNVLIYFDQPTKTNILGRLAQRLAPDGFLMLGGAETVLGVSDRFAVMAEQRGVYRPATAAPPAPAFRAAG